MRSQLYVTELNGEGGAPQRHVPAIYCDDGRLTEFRHLLGPHTCKVLWAVAGTRTLLALLPQEEDSCMEY